MELIIKNNLKVMMDPEYAEILKRLIPESLEDAIEEKARVAYAKIELDDPKIEEVEEKHNGMTTPLSEMFFLETMVLIKQYKELGINLFNYKWEADIDRCAEWATMKFDTAKCSETCKWDSFNIQWIISEAVRNFMTEVIFRGIKI